MTLHYVGGKTAECTVIKETKKYIVFSAAFGVKYRLNKETGEVQDNAYHKAIEGLWVER